MKTKHLYKNMFKLEKVHSASFSLTNKKKKQTTPNRFKIQNKYLSMRTQGFLTASYKPSSERTQLKN